MLAYVDASVWIARVEGKPDYKTTVEERLDGLTRDGWRFCVSKAVLMETFYKPYREKEHALVSVYNELFSKAKMLHDYANLLEDGLRIMKAEHLKAMDSIHVAMALHHGCDGFISTDTDFQNLKSIRSLWIDLSIVS